MIRGGALKDLEAVVALERGAETAPHWGVEVYREILGGEEGLRCLFVAEVNGAVVGFAVGVLVAEEGEVESVVVRAESRQQGLGRALLRAVLEWCGDVPVRLEVRAGSLEVIRLYGVLGFGETGRRAGYYKDPVEDAVLMLRW